MPDNSTLTSRLFDGLSIYQDVVFAGRTARVGQRDCEARWQLIEPYLPRAGAILDIGSNFGWFPLKICQTRPDCVVASAEANWRSARVQYEVLASHEAIPEQSTNVHGRICLIRRRINSQTLRVWVDHRQRFDATLCLNVLHWIRDHRALMHALGAISATIFVEHPDADEAGAGLQQVREQIGPIGPYLSQVFPHRQVVCLGTFPSHRDDGAGALRTMWMVEPPRHWAPNPAPGLDVEALMKMHPAWPAPDWWLLQGLNLTDVENQQMRIESNRRDGVWLTPAGLRIGGHPGADRLASLQSRFAQIPESLEPGWRDRARDAVRWVSGLGRRLG